MKTVQLEDFSAAWRQGFEGARQCRADLALDDRLVCRRGTAAQVDVYSRNGDVARLTVATTLSGGMGGDVTVERSYDLEAGS